MKKSSTTRDLELQAHASVMLRLMGALVRERLLPADCEMVRLQAPFPEEITLRFPNQTQLLGIKRSTSGAQFYIPFRHSGAFRRLKLLAPIWYQADQKWLRLDWFDQLIAHLRQDFGVDLPEPLEWELKNGLDFLVYGYQQRAKQKEILFKRLTKTSIKTKRYVEAIQQLKEKEAFDEYLFSEALSIEGNPLHPCAKTRLGLSLTERQYLPESCSPVPIHILLIPKKDVHLTSVLSEDANSFLFRLEPTLKEAAQQACKEKGVTLEEFQLFFVHPWQYQHVIKSEYRRAFNDWIVLPQSLDARALLSFRTMDVKKLGIHLKLPVQIQMTNAVRTLSPQATVNGPILSRICQQVLDGQKELERFIVLPELIGAYYQAEWGDDHSYYARNLSYLIREHPRKYVKQGELAFVGAALAEKTLWGQPLIIDLMQQAVGKSDLTLEDAINYLTEYAQRILPPFLYLMQHYGIALEGHMQNVVVVVKQGQIERLLVRDMGGLRIHRQRFQQKFGDLDLWDGPIFADEMSEVHKKFLHSVLQNHMGELIFVVADALKIPERPLWEGIAEVIRESLDPTSPEGREDRVALFQPVIQTKALLSMRQEDRSANDYIYMDLPNPLTRSDDDAL